MDNEKENGRKGDREKECMSERMKE